MFCARLSSTRSKAPCSIIIYIVRDWSFCGPARLFICVFRNVFCVFSSAPSPQEFAGRGKGRLNHSCDIVRNWGKHRRRRWGISLNENTKRRKKPRGVRPSCVTPVGLNLTGSKTPLRWPSRTCGDYPHSLLHIFRLPSDYSLQIDPTNLSLSIQHTAVDRHTRE